MKPILALILIGLGSVNSIADELPLTPVCWPPNFAGITLGVTTDSEVERLLGKGIFTANPAYTGNRYYVDPKRTATLHSVGYTDYVIGEVTVEEGIKVSPSDITKATSKWFNPQQGFGNWHALHLGSSKEDVRKNLGTPAKESTNDAWRYDSKCACELEVYFTLFFRNDRIFKVVFSAPPG